MTHVFTTFEALHVPRVDGPLCSNLFGSGPRTCKQDRPGKALHTERSRAARMQLGTSFRSQSRFDEYIAARQASRDFTFRQHLRSIG
jgi:hypothetical protein